MHGLINRTIERFVRETRGESLWLRVAEQAELGFVEFEAMLSYDAALTERVLEAVSAALLLPRESVLEDIGTYLVSHQKTEAVRRLLRFGGVDFVEFLHSLEDLPDRARLAVADLSLPGLELDEQLAGRFSLKVLAQPAGFGAVMLGVLRAMADDYGALVILEYFSDVEGEERIEIQLIEEAFAAGRGFELGARAG
ncbi:heme NO-binding domain-containing protein [uncultured Lentibacter sp.]|uniref:heme NO-binding domain-containing protein n=1 Tax=uncultured Lentibacter sp. TaxID=1659309 RepID=UPI0026116ACF|nr:heme NO-binding domain-containing protein [uncultured Lentibacter sp.]MCW1956280.1 heme NO-binding domain-containing protein [Roseobacter sp.]